MNCSCNKSDVDAISWGNRYIDDCILHQEDSNIDGTYDDIWYHITDVQFSTVAILDDAAALVERISYDAYGKARHHYRSDIDGDGDVDSADGTEISDALNKSIDDAAYNVDADINRDEIVDNTDRAIFNSDNPTSALAAGLISDPAVNNQVGWDGYLFNAETSEYLSRNRTNNPTLGRWRERDPLEYVDGMNLYEYVGSNPINGLDPFGLQDPRSPEQYRRDAEAGAAKACKRILDKRIPPAPLGCKQRREFHIGTCCDSMSKNGRSVDWAFDCAIKRMDLYNNDCINKYYKRNHDPQVLPDCVGPSALTCFKHALKCQAIKYGGAAAVASCLVACYAMIGTPFAPAIPGCLIGCAFLTAEIDKQIKACWAAHKAMGCIE